MAHDEIVLGVMAVKYRIKILKDSNYTYIPYHGINSTYSPYQEQ